MELVLILALHSQLQSTSYSSCLQIQQVKQKVAEGMAQLNAQLGVGRKLLHDEDDDEEGEKAAKKAEKKAKKAAKKAEKKAKKEKHDEWKEHRVSGALLVLHTAPCMVSIWQQAFLVSVPFPTAQAN